MKNRHKIKNKKIFSHFLLVFLLFPIFTLADEGENVDLTQDIINLTNQEREKEGLGSLKENGILSQAALLKAQDMDKNNYFAHNSPSGTDPWHWFDAVGYDYKYAGENLAVDFTSAKSVNRAWMKSPTHKENILSGNYTEIGVAVIDGEIEGEETKIAVQLFGKPLVEESRMLSTYLKELNDKAQIVAVSVRPWEDLATGEVMVHAQIAGYPNEVLLQSGEEETILKKMGPDRYIGVLALKEINKDSGLTVVAKKANQEDVTHKIEEESYSDFLEGKTSTLNLTATLASMPQKGPDVSFSSFILAGFVGICIVMIVDVWLLEREEKRLVDDLMRSV